MALIDGKDGTVAVTVQTRAAIPPNRVRHQRADRSVPGIQGPGHSRGASRSREAYRRLSDPFFFAA
jgi:hypothetical protein